MTTTTTTAAQVTAAKAAIRERLGQHRPGLLALSAELHADPEVAFNEHRSAGRVAAQLWDAGFATTVGCYGLPTAIEAVYGTGSFRVVICAEYDALPEIGHACGHNIIAAAAVGAAVSLAAVADELDLTVVLLGTPAEEEGGGKVLLLDAGAFAQADIALMAHPTPGGDIDCTGTSSQGCDRFRVMFRGKASHAAAAPADGVNALNAATVAQVAIGLLRQQLPDGVRINALVTAGGSAINVIPDYSELALEVRALDVDVQNDTTHKVLLACEGAALATGCTWSVEQPSPAYLPVLQHEALLRLWNRNLTATGRTLVAPPAAGGGGGSTDMGNVSQAMPAIHPVIAVLGARGMPHTAAFADETSGPAADAAVMDAALALAWTAADAAADSELRASLQSARRTRQARS
ncbi:M20 family metallopeptidase [Arthrobacter sp. zg-Y820]|uniref:M20 family metallopeptidase n=1 Tax=unclassified Arthrobacter TaxID=235627 RepID=UPI001E5130DE|nr:MULTISPECIES: M20 family metallopeptidase [unclassified Arthrobacter]MCC9197652.1 M20 family metallopeptidase [Arthrobacter sp. zg-Y820]MDK1280519.1 M20 family metallopeptidase [Arthrobacter sp. zg.Y820]WIB10842.1 M20 family metallopeptidase [Arthrobacter sp. zg-Y820]